MTEKRNLLEFLHLVGRLKHIPRTGWVLRNVNKPETISGHMYRMAMMAFLLDDTDPLDKRRCMEMALVHDLAESIIGDFTPYCNISPAEKHKRESEAMSNIAKLMGKNGDGVYQLFMEYEAQSTPEAKFVKELDLFDMALQAFEYEKAAGTPRSLQEFIDSTMGKFSHSLICDLHSQMLAERELFKNEIL